MCYLPKKKPGYKSGTWEAWDSGGGGGGGGGLLLQTLQSMNLLVFL